MSLLFRVALLGFSAPERSALAGCFRLVTHRVPRYEQVQLADHADLMVADADDDLSARQVLDSGRLPDTVLVGRRPLPADQQADFHRFMLQDVERLDTLIDHLLDAAKTLQRRPRPGGESVDLVPI
ncbi:MAG: hypothetical protein ACOVOU_00930, partial [Rubrivivax sp.]